MKIISYNVNGIRAAISKGLLEWLQQANPDVICFQEIKAQADQVPTLDIELAGYPYHYWFPATKKGYSGVAILSKTKPNNIVFGTGIEHMDFEGRNIRVDFDDVSVMSCICLLEPIRSAWITSSCSWMISKTTLMKLRRMFLI